MAVGLFWNDRVSFEKHEWAKRFFFLGNNTGNLVFIRALKDIFHPVMIPLWDVTSDTFRDRADITHYITTELIWLTPNQTYPHVWTMLKRIGDKPLVPISVGVQSMARNVDITLHPDTVKLLRTMAERAVLGVRGEYTAAVLEKNGIVNFRIIGCPSLYQGMNEKFRVEKKPFDPAMRACCNFRTFYGTLSDPERQFLTFCANRDLGFVEQNAFQLTLENCCGDEYQFRYLQDWLKRQMHVFFHIEDWLAWVRQYDFSLGSRFHGNVIAITSGIPALTMVVDSRMDEMTRLFRLPTLPMENFRLEKPLEYYYDLADYTDFNKAYPERMRVFRDFLQRNGLAEGADDTRGWHGAGRNHPKSAANRAPDALREPLAAGGDAAGALVGLAQPAAANPHLLVRLFRRAGNAGKKRLPVSPVADVRHDAVAGAQLRHSRRVRVHPAGRVHHPQRAHSALHHPDEGGCARVLRAFVDDGDSADCAAPWRRAGDVALSGTGVLPRGFVGAADRRGTADEQPDGGLSRFRRAASAADAPAVLCFQRRVDGLSPGLQRVMRLNPLVYIIEGYRKCLLYGEGFWSSPGQGAYFWLAALALLAAGCTLHMRLRNRFIDQL